MFNIYESDRVLKIECSLQDFSRNCIIKNLDEMKQMRQTLFVERRAFKCEGERNGYILHYEQVFGNAFERKESKCYPVLIKHRRKVNGEQVITLQKS